MLVLTRQELKAKLRRAAAHLQGGSTAYFSDAAKLGAIRMLYRLADEASLLTDADFISCGLEAHE